MFLPYSIDLWITNELFQRTNFELQFCIVSKRLIHQYIRSVRYWISHSKISKTVIWYEEAKAHHSLESGTEIGIADNRIVKTVEISDL